LVHAGSVISSSIATMRNKALTQNWYDRKWEKKQEAGG
jgi:hypothetical protein